MAAACYPVAVGHAARRHRISGDHVAELAALGEHRLHDECRFIRIHLQRRLVVGVLHPVEISSTGRDDRCPCVQEIDAADFKNDVLGAGDGNDTVVLAHAIRGEVAIEIVAQQRRAIRSQALLVLQLLPMLLLQLRQLQPNPELLVL
jgi:hypothetical protein